jgi:hypothetical protein
MLRISSENAEKMIGWLKTRGGIAVWKSANLSNPGKQAMSPVNNPEGKPYNKPDDWELSDVPEIVTDIADVEVSDEDKEVKRFHVGVRRGSQGTMLKLTDAATARVNSEVTKAGKDAYYVFDYMDYRNCVIMVPSRVIPLSEYAKEKGL